MANPNSKLYTSDITEAEKCSPDYGDVEVLIASDKEKLNTFENDGNQDKAYYNNDLANQGAKSDTKVGNQSSAYYAD